jgi:hypothetical protein
VDSQIIKKIGYEKFNLEARAYIIHREGTVDGSISFYCDGIMALDIDNEFLVMKENV